jgi:hypothetical protein
VERFLAMAITADHKAGCSGVVPRTCQIDRSIGRPQGHQRSHDAL